MRKLVYRATQLVISAVVSALYGYDVRGRENVPKHGGVIVASNHRSEFDPPLVGSAIPRNGTYFAKIELFRPPLGWIIPYFGAFPVRRGEADRDAFKTAIRLLRRGECLVYFPEGTRARGVPFREPLPGVGALARAAGVPIVPAYIENSNLGRPFGGKRVRVTFGELINIEWVSEQGKGKEAALIVAQEVMLRIRVKAGESALEIKSS